MSAAVFNAPSSLPASRSQNGLSDLRAAAPLGAPLASGMGAPMVNKPAVVEHRHYRFLIHDAPTDNTLPSYLEYMKRKKVVTLVRACEPTYDKAPLEREGIKVVELPFQDGSPPPDAMITTWLGLVAATFDKPASAGKKDAASGKGKGSGGSSSDIKCAIAVHCVAGLGRAPVLVCIALIESGMGWMEAVELVRRKRRGALNLTQLQYLETYKPRGKKDSCTIM